MKAITVIQPWATLIALSEKKFETRSWRTNHRGDLAIHAAKKIDKAGCRQDPIRSVLAKHGYDEKNLPTGVILATCELHDCMSIHLIEGAASLFGSNSGQKCLEISGNEFHFGWYEDGRFAWELLNVEMLERPIPAKGQLGLWNYPV